MKKIFTISIAVLFIASLNLKLFAQCETCNDPEYANKKAEFWNQYQVFKNNVDRNIFSPKPEDPNGLFYIDENNNFNVKTSGGKFGSLNAITPFSNWLGQSDAVSSGYTFSQSTTSYASINTTGTLDTNNCDDGYKNLPIGFSFNFNGALYTTVTATCNGWMMMGAGAPSGYSPINTGTFPNVIVPFARDLRGGPGATDNGIYYQTTGSAPNRVFTIEWYHWGIYSTGLNELDFQVKLYETSNIIEFVYKPETPTTSITNVEVGLMGATNADFLKRTTSTDWSATTSGLLADYCYFSTTVYPPLGLTFTWTPQSMVYLSSNTMQLLSGVGVSGNTVNNQIIKIQVVTSGFLSPFSATKFNLGTEGSTNPGTDITNAKLYYTGTSNSFSTASLFGTAAAPSGSFIINGSQQLEGGSNYFWLIYDVPGTATIGDTLDARCDSVTVNSTAYAPDTSAPVGNRIITGIALCGTKTIPGDYASITAAITDLNTYGVCPTGVTFNVAAGFTETAANLVLTASGTSTGPIVFQKSGVGANPLITAGVGVSTTLDGVIKFSGADYITFDGIDVQENVLNVDATTQMEWGYALLKVDGTNGSQNNVIKNCSITLNKTNVNTKGIYLANHTIASTTALTVTATSGANSGNKFYSNIISNALTGVSLNGYSTAAYYDQNNEVGTMGGGQSKISNYGNAATTAYGVYGIYQTGIKVFNTNINNSGGAAATGTLYGIFLSTGTNANVDIYGDTVTVSSSGTTSQMAGIYNNMGTSGTDNTVNIYNNVIQNCTYTTATTAAVYYMYHSASCYNFNFYGNKVINNVYGSASATATGSNYYIYLLSGIASNNIWQVYNNVVSSNSRVQSVAGTSIDYTFYVSAAVPTLNVYGNVVSDNTLPTTTSTSYLFYLPGAAVNLNCYNNTVKNITRIATTGPLYCFYLTGGTAGGVHNIYNNSLNNLNITSTGATYCYYLSSSVNKNIYKDSIYNITSSGGAIYGIYHTAGLVSQIYNNEIHGINTTSTVYGLYYSGTTSSQIHDNKIYDLTTATSAVYGGYIGGGATNEFYNNSIYDLYATTGTIYGGYIVGGTTNYFYNNFISDLQATTSTSAVALAGVYSAGGTNNFLFYNTIYLNAASTSATTFGTAGIYASTTPTLDMRNNIIVNNSTPGPTGGFTSAYFRNTTNFATYAAASDNNVFYVTPGTRRMLYYDGTNLIDNMDAYKPLVAPRDANSFSENPPFINVSTTPYNLHISGSIQTGIESSGIPISVPITITTDFDGNTRNATTPDIGADEGNFIYGDLQAPAVAYTPLGNTTSTSNRTLDATITDNHGLQNTPPNDPRIYYKKGANGTIKYQNKTSQVGNVFTFTIYSDSLGVVLWDTVFYYVAAQDVGTPPLNPNVTTNPSGGSGFNPPGTVPPSVPNFYIIVTIPLSGIYSIPGDYATISAAIGDLNLRGINGPTTFNVAPNHTEIASNLTLLTTGTAANPIVFQKAGSDDKLLLNNPAIIAAPGTGLLDGIIKLSGVDYITFNGIDLRDTLTNSNDTTSMEVGYGLLKADGTNGCRYVTIKNCEITLNKTNINAAGIYAANHTVSSTSTLTVTDTLGTNSYNKFYSNTISNVNYGIVLSGYADISPYAYYDKNNEVGTTGSLQNKIYNFGGAASGYGIYGIYQNGAKIFNTNVNNSGGAPALLSLYGIYMSTGINSNLDIYSDTITLAAGGTSSACYGIYNAMGGTGTSNTVNIYNNIVKNCTYDGATTATMYYMYLAASSYNFNCYGNKIINNTYGSATTTATGTIGYMYTFGGTATNNLWQIYNNEISGNSRVQSALSTGTTYVFYNGGTGVTLNVYNNLVTDNILNNTSTNYLFYLGGASVNLSCYNNTVKNITRNASAGATYCYYLTGGTSGGVHNIYNNSLNNLNLTTTGATYCLYSSASVDKNIYQDSIYNITSSGGSVYGLYYAGGLTGQIYKNNIYGLSSGTSGVVWGAYILGGTTNHFYQNRVQSLTSATGTVYGTYISSGTTNYCYNNIISNLQSTASTSTIGVAGLYISGGTTDNIFYNTIYVNAVSTSTTTFGTAGIYASTTPTVDMRNNIVVNVSTPGPTGGFTSAYQRSSTTLTTYSANSNNNCFYAGTGTNRLIYYDGTNSDPTIEAFQTRVTPRDNSSFAENPPFINITTAPYNLHISGSIPTFVESHGVPITTPIAITADYDGEARNVSTPDVGADEGTFNGLLAPLAPQLVSPPNGATNQPTALTCVWTRPLGLEPLSRANTRGISTETSLEKGKEVTDMKSKINSVSELDDIETVYKFWFEIVTDTNSMTNLLLDSSLTDTTKALSGLNSQTVYYWRVKAKNAVGWGPYSAWWRFTTTMAAPAPPVLVSPPDGATGVTVPVTFVWHLSATAVSYRLQVATDSLFTTIIYNDSTITDTTKTVSGLPQLALLFWRVSAKNPGGTSAYSAMWRFTTAALNPSLSIKVYLEGFYSPEPLDNKTGKKSDGKDSPLAQVPDTVRIYLADSLQNYAFVDSVKIFLPSSGQYTTPFTGVTTGKYYIVVKHRNHLETWSKYAVSFTGGSTTSYDFTTGAGQAYGDNMKLVGSVWVIFGGDANQDGDINALEIPIFILQFGTQGYLSCDFNGDNDVTGIDQQILIQNFGTTVARPTTLLILNPGKGKGLKEYQEKLKQLQGIDIRNNK